MDQTEGVFIFPKNRDDAEVFFLGEVDARMEAACKFWDCGGQV